MSQARTEYIGLVLAGGGSRRFGSPKALAQVGGSPIIARVLASLGEVLSATAIATNENRIYEGFGVPLLPDRVRGGGPLAGIESGLATAARLGASGALCVPCDAPFVDPELLERLLDVDSGVDVVLPRSDGPLGYEPLFGRYSVRLLPTIRAHLASEQRAMHALIESLENVVLIPPPVRDGLDPRHLFFNVNTRDDLEVARRLAPDPQDG